MRQTSLAATVIVLALLGLGAQRARAEITVSVPGTANIFGAGHTAAPDPGSYGAGTLPIAVELISAPTRTMTFDAVSGEVSCKPLLGWNGADGGPYATGTTDILSYNGISGIINQHSTMFLVGVFTDGTVPLDPGPARLDVSETTGDAEFTPLLFQSFFIGDGLTGTGNGAVQVFHVPASATTLYLGFADGYGFGDPTDLPGSYNDNAGSLTVSMTVVPSPGCLVLALGGVCLAVARRRSRT